VKTEEQEIREERRGTKEYEDLLFGVFSIVIHQHDWTAVSTQSRANKHTKQQNRMRRMREKNESVKAAYLS
jgi:hypothetical protein